MGWDSEFYEGPIVGYMVSSFVLIIHGQHIIKIKFVYDDQTKHDYYVSVIPFLRNFSLASALSVPACPSSVIPVS